MRYESRTCLLVALASMGLFACANSAEPEWSCSTNQVPNGQTTSCVGSGPTLADGTYAGCPATVDGKTICPPGVTEQAASSTTPTSANGVIIAYGSPEDLSNAGGSSGVAGASAAGSDENGKESASNAGAKNANKGNQAAQAGGAVGAEASANTTTSTGTGTSTTTTTTTTTATATATGTGAGAATNTAANSGADAGTWQCVVQNGSVDCHKTQCASGTQVLTCGACVPSTQWIAYDDCLPPDAGGCWITGGGFVTDTDGKDSFGGNGMPMKDGRIRGEWEHVDHGTGNKLHGEVSYLVCRHVAEPGPGQPSGPSHNFTLNQAYYGGSARWFSNGAWADGYWFDIMAEDHGEPGNKAGPGNHGSAGPDYYHLRVLQMQNGSQSGTLIYETEGDFDGGNFQIHPPNGGHPYTSSALPSWVQLQP